MRKWVTRQVSLEGIDPELLLLPRNLTETKTGHAAL